MKNILFIILMLATSLYAVAQSDVQTATGTAITTFTGSSSTKHHLTDNRLAFSNVSLDTSREGNQTQANPAA